MPQWLKFKKIDKGYFDPKTGKKLASIKGRRNRPGIDVFTHFGTIYTRQMGKGRSVKETENEVILELNITDSEADLLIAEEPELEPYKLTPEEIAELLPEQAEDNVAS